MPGIMDDESEPESTLHRLETKHMWIEFSVPKNGRISSTSCRVHHVTTIASLELSHCNLREVPSCIKMLKLKELKLSHNDLRVVPVCLYTGLKTLECIDLSYNMLTSFEIEPACCPVLKRLVVSHNHIKNFPQWISMGLAPNITDVIYTDNEICHLRPPVHKMNLETLEMASCLLRDADYNFLTSFRKLKKLVMGNLHAKDARANYFKDLATFISNFFAEQLEVLNLNHISLSIIPCDLFWNERLVELHLVDCDIFVIGPEIKYLTKLAILDISHNCLSHLPVELGNLEGLRTLKAAGNIIDTAPKFKSKLDTLDLYDNRLNAFPQFDDDGFLPSLIDLERNFMPTDPSELCDRYSEAKTRYRELSGFENRSDGARDLERYWESSSSTSSLSSLSIAGDYEPSSKLRDFENVQDFNDADYENWDEEIQMNEEKKFERHPDVSPSDDEWDAVGPVPKYQPLSYVSFVSFPPDPDEDWVFCDAV